jgi:hypothetical protein
MNLKRNTWSIAFIPLKNFLSIWHFKLIGLIGPRAVSEIELKIDGATKKLINRQRHLSKYRSTHPYHLQPVSISRDSPFKEGGCGVTGVGK